MQPQTTTTTATPSYTTIPISTNDVISRSIENLSSFLSLRRPWSQFIAAGVFDRPDSLSTALSRLRNNSSYFRLNYALLTLTCILISLVPAPLSLICLAFVSALWLLLYFFREDPLFLWDHYVSDRFVLIGLISLTAITIWFAGAVGNIIIGVMFGLAASVVHGAFRNEDGLFLDENEAVSSGLLVPVSDRNMNNVK